MGSGHGHSPPRDAERVAAGGTAALLRRLGAQDHGFILASAGVAGPGRWSFVAGAPGDTRDVARRAFLLSGLPIEDAGQTVNRLCGSGLQAINSAAQAIQTGAGDTFVAGGVESMTRAPFVIGKADSPFSRNMSMQDTTLGWRFMNPKLSAVHHPYSMGETAENVAQRYGISRADQDAYALRSHQEAVAAQQSGRFAVEIIPVTLPHKKGTEAPIVALDEHPRADTSLEKLATLKPVFRKEGGTVTAGNSAGINDGSAALVLMALSQAKRLGLRPRARFVASAVAGVDPAYMGRGPIFATRKVNPPVRPTP